MKILTVAQHKGGVGKTTLAKLLIEYFARREKRILAIDLDTQSNLSRHLLAMDYDSHSPEGVLPPVHDWFDPADPDQDGWSGRSSSADLFYDGEVYPYSSKIADTVSVLPADGSRLRRVQLVNEEVVTERVHGRLLDFVRLPEVVEQFDLVVVDTSPSKDPLTISAIRAASHLLLPMVMEPQCVEGLHGMLGLRRTQNRFRDPGDPIRIVGIVPNMMRNTTLHRDILADLRSQPEVSRYVTPFEIHQRVAFAESDHPDATPLSVFDLPASDLARQEAECLCQFVAAQIGIGETGNG